MTHKDIAATLMMCEKSVQRFLALFQATGSVTPQPHTGGPPKVLDDSEQFIVMQALIHNPTMYLYEIQEHLHQLTGKRVCLSTICRTIKEKGFTRKKVQSIALQQSEQQRISFMVKISMYSPDMFIWIDETGSDKRNCIREYGYSLRGLTPQTFPAVCIRKKNICNTSIDNQRDRRFALNIWECQW